MGRQNEKLLFKFKGYEVIESKEEGVFLYKDGGYLLTYDFLESLLNLLKNEEFAKNFSDPKHFYQLGNTDTGGTENRKILTILDGHQLFKGKEPGQIFMHTPTGSNFNLDIDLLHEIKQQCSDGERKSRENIVFGSNIFGDTAPQLTFKQKYKKYVEGNQHKFRTYEYDCSEIADDIEAMDLTQETQRLEIVPADDRHGVTFKVEELGEINEFVFHHAIVLNNQVYDPRHSVEPVPLEQYKESFKTLNSGTELTFSYI